jgi:hypothetical protein
MRTSLRAHQHTRVTRRHCQISRQRFLNAVFHAQLPRFAARRRDLTKNAIGITLGCTKKRLRLIRKN